jgi:hypothetical protein
MKQNQSGLIHCTSITRRNTLSTGRSTDFSVAAGYAEYNHKFYDNRSFGPTVERAKQTESRVFS